jgi:hypothetical protein
LVTFLAPLDDRFHALDGGEPYWTETIWLGFAVPERRVSGVTYAVMRPNLSVCSLGVFVWDDNGASEQDCLYFESYPHLPLPADLSAFDLTCGYSHQVIEPSKKYRMSYDDGVELLLDLEFEGIHPPIARGHGDSVDGSNQLGRVTGQIRLNGEEINVDCLQFRGRAWTVRGDSRFAPRQDGQEAQFYSDTFAATKNSAFFVSTMGDSKTTLVLNGYFLNHGEAFQITEGSRVVERDPVHGYPTRVTIEAMDESGRLVNAVGECVNHLRMATVPGVPFPFWVNGTTWLINGDPAWGEDQDVPVGRPGRHFIPAPE